MSVARWLLILMLAVLAACATTPAPVVVPKVVRVAVPQYVPIPDELTKDCPIAMPKTMSVGEAIRVARERRASLEACNADKAALRKLGEGQP
jgi:hypothetical protein